MFLFFFFNLIAIISASFLEKSINALLPVVEEQLEKLKKKKGKGRKGNLTVFNCIRTWSTNALQK